MVFSRFSGAARNPETKTRAGRPELGRVMDEEEEILFLAERIEEHISKEHAKVIDITQKAVQKVSQPKKTA